MPSIFLALPHYGRTDDGTTPTAAIVAVTERDDIDVALGKFGCSMLPKTFNVLWTQALQGAREGRYTHFAMLHDDIAAESDWLGKLLGIAETRGDAVVSVVSPIKDARGLTSCGLSRPDSNWAVRRLTLSEVHNRLPPEFSTADVEAAGINLDDDGTPRTGWPLVFNTGCWLLDLRLPIWRETDRRGVLKFFFRFNDEAFWDEGRGCYRTRSESEDWFFSRRVHEAGLPYCCTRSIKLRHFGEIAFGNERGFGQERDEQFFAAGGEQVDESEMLICG